MPDDDNATIRRAESVADYLACQQAQRRAWGIADDSYVVPLATLIGAQLHGGLVLGAFAPDGEALGLSFAFLGKVEGRPCLYSQLTGVVPGQQGRGLGFRLKQAQRDFARSEGIPTLAWAFDPLQAGNARFNLGHLGATAARYVEDMYGRRTDALNADARTDRLIVEWATDPAQTGPTGPDPASFPSILIARPRPDGLAEPLELGRPEAPGFLLEIPADIASIRRADPGLAEAWTLAVRGAFNAAFAAGYRAEGFVRDTLDDRARFAYVLRLKAEGPGR